MIDDILIKLNHKFTQRMLFQAASKITPGLEIGFPLKGVQMAAHMSSSPTKAAQGNAEFSGRFIDN